MRFAFVPAEPPDPLDVVPEEPPVVPPDVEPPDVEPLEVLPDVPLVVVLDVPVAVVALPETLTLPLLPPAFADTVPATTTAPPVTTIEPP